MEEQKGMDDVLSVSSEECKSQVQADLFHTVKTPMSANMVVIGLVNGMIGGTCLVVPDLVLKTGWLMSIIVCIVIGWISYYTAYLIILHLGKGPQVKDCILSHFNNDYNYMRGYSFIIWFNYPPSLVIYFRIICLQIEGLLGHHSSAIAPAVAIGLIVLIIIIRIYHVGEETLAYGIISIIGYLVFLLWAQTTAPSGPKTVPLSNQPSNLASTLIFAFSIHGFLVANVIKNPNRSDYHGAVRKTFVIGTLVYAFIALGSFSRYLSNTGIVNRTPYKQNPETINQFFKPGEWQNSLIEVVYMLHMISAFPNFLIISKIRFFQMFKIVIKHKIDWHEVVYIITFIAICFFVYIAGVHLQVMIILNGAVVGYTYIIVIPIWLHFKCVFYDRSSGYIQNDPQWNSGIVANKCECDNVYKNKFMLYLETVFLVLVLIFGFILIVFSIRNAISESYKSHN